MWHNRIGMVVMWIVLCVFLVQERAVYSSDDTISLQSEILVTNVERVLSLGNQDDEIPVIVTLQIPSYARTFGMTTLEKQQRTSMIKMTQQDFAMRHAAYVRFTNRQPHLFPVMFATMRRGDVRKLASDPRVANIHQDTLSAPLMDISTMLIGSQAANAAGVDGRGTSVAVLDTGVLTSHEFLSGQVVAESCFSNVYGSGTAWYNGTSLCPSGNNTPFTASNQVGSAAPCVGMSGCDHGTHVSGTVAGKVIDKGSYVMRGVAPAAKIIGIQVFTNFSGRISSWGADQLLAMEWLLEHKDTSDWGELASLNMSLGGGQYTAICDDSNALTPAINELRTLGIATVIASGNDGYLDSISGPACISSAITVGSTTTSSAISVSGVIAEDEIAPYSNAPSGTNNNSNIHGDRLLDLLAPGMYIWSSLSANTTSYGYNSGTSMAAPHVAGAWALLKQVASDASVSQVLTWFRDSGIPLTDNRPSTGSYAYRYGSVTPTPYTLLYADRPSLSLPRIQVNHAVSTAAAAVTDTPIPTSTPTAAVTDTPVVSTPTATTMPTATSIPKPGAFVKSAPANALTNRPLTMTLTWGASSGVSRYEYCVANTATTCTRWVNVGVSRSVVLQNLVSNRTYYWNVRAVNAYGVTLSNGGTWRFTTTSQSLPGSFAKIAPANGVTNRPLNTALSWNVSAGAARYEYCLATSATSCTNWKSVGTARAVVPGGLVRNRTYFWQVRAVNTAGETVSVGGVWRFTTIR